MRGHKDRDYILSTGRRGAGRTGSRRSSPAELGRGGGAPAASAYWGGGARENDHYVASRGAACPRGNGITRGWFGLRCVVMAPYRVRRSDRRLTREATASVRREDQTAVCPNQRREGQGTRPDEPCTHCGHRISSPPLNLNSLTEANIRHCGSDKGGGKNAFSPRRIAGPALDARWRVGSDAFPCAPMPSASSSRLCSSCAPPGRSGLRPRRRRGQGASARGAALPGPPEARCPTGAGRVDRPTTSGATSASGRTSPVAGEKLPFQVQFFHPGLYYDRTVAGERRRRRRRPPGAVLDRSVRLRQERLRRPDPGRHRLRRPAHPLPAQAAGLLRRGDRLPRRQLLPRARARQRLRPLGARPRDRHRRADAARSSRPSPSSGW